MWFFMLQQQLFRCILNMLLKANYLGAEGGPLGDSCTVSEPWCSINEVHSCRISDSGGTEAVWLLSKSCSKYKMYPAQQSHYRHQHRCALNLPHKTCCGLTFSLSQCEKKNQRHYEIRNFQVSAIVYFRKAPVLQSHIDPS